MTTTSTETTTGDRDTGHGHGHDDQVTGQLTADTDIPGTATNGQQDRGHHGQVTGQDTVTTADNEAVGHHRGQAGTGKNTGIRDEADRPLAPAVNGGPVTIAATGTGVEKSVAAPESESDAATMTNPYKSKYERETSSINPTPATGEKHKTTGSGLSHRINPDDRRFIRLIVAGYIIAGLVAFAISFVALMEVAAWLGLPVWMHWGIPAFIDVAILVNAGAVLVHKSRGESAWKAWLALFTFTALSVVANTAHALSHEQETEWQSIIAAVIAGMVPMAIFAATEQLAAVAVEDPEARRQELEAQETWAAQQAEREQRRLEMEHQREIARQKAELDREEHLTEIELRRAQREELLARARTNQAPTATSAGATPTPPASSSPKASGSSTQLDEVAVWITQRTQAGEDTTGKDLEDHFGVSQRTGRRYLKKLRETQPEIFLTDEGDHR